MIQGLHLIPEDTHVPFIKMRFVAFIISALMVVAAVFFLSTKGLNFGIDFSGGILIEIKTEGPANLTEMRNQLSNLDLGEVSLQEFGSPEEVMIRVQSQEGGEEAQQAAIDQIHAVLGEEVEYRRVEVVGPQVGGELIKKGFYAVLFSIGGILAYIWFRFEWQFSVAAILALLHDTIITLGLFSLLDMEFSLSTVAAVLTIAGYSTNDTVVVFDRVREYLRKYKKKPLEELFDMSINSMLSRTLLTSSTTLIALIALWSFGGEVIRSFVDALIWGVLIGTYSSVFVATPLLLYMGIERDGSGK